MSDYSDLKTQRYEVFDILRGVMCILIFLGHAPGFIMSMDNNITREWNRMFTGGPIVTCWFVMAGFFAYISLSKTKESDLYFFKRKVKRFYPVYIFCFFLSLLSFFVAPAEVVGGVRLREIIITLLLHLTLTQALVPTEASICAYCSTSWYLSCLMLLYLTVVPLYKLIMWLKMKKGNGVWKKYICIAWGSLYFAEMFCIACVYKSPFMYEFPVFRFCEFSGGIVIGAMICDKQNLTIKNNRNYILPVLQIISILAWIVSMYIFHNIGIYGWKHMISESPFIMMVIYTLALSGENKIYEGILSRILMYISEYSLEIFLIHYSVLRFFRMISISSYGLSLIYCAGAFLVSLKLAEIVNKLSKVVKKNG